MSKKVLLFYALLSSICAQGQNLNIMLCPFGDAKTTGRIIDDSFERSIALKFAEEIKKEVEQKNKNVQVTLNRVPGETLEPLQNANFANRLNVDFYLSIHFFKEIGARPKVFIFTYAQDNFHLPINSKLAFVQFDEAFKINLKQTELLAKRIENVLKQEKYKHSFDFKELLKIPFRPLRGIKAPNVAFEASLKTSTDWRHYITPVVEAINAVIEGLQCKQP